MYSSHSNLSVKGEKQGERQRRAVSFRPMVSCMKIRQRGNAADIYYQAEELEEILDNALDTLEKMEAGVALDDVHDCGAWSDTCRETKPELSSDEIARRKLLFMVFNKRRSQSRMRE